ncbi:MAG: hypothetical protein Q9168_004977 [Polycauliona sp. 1 TL-2023]
MRQQVIVRGKGSTYSDSPQPASNGIKWASVNGYQSSPAEADSYHQRQSLDGEESSDDYELSSAPDSDHEGRLSKQCDQPARSTPSHPLHVAMPDIPPQQPVVPSMPVIAPEGPQANGQHLPEFDVFDAQSRGQPIAPRQFPPKPSSTPVAFFDNRSPMNSNVRPPARAKRGREVEAVDPEFRTANSFNKRRKQQNETTDPPNNTSGIGEEYAMPFNPPPTMPIPLAPPRVFSDSELDDLCIRFRDSYRMMGAYYHEEHRIMKELFDAALDRANLRAAAAVQRLDEADQICAEEAKEARLSSQMEYENMKKKLGSEISENRRLAEELASCRQRLAAADGPRERQMSSTVANNMARPDVEMKDALQASLVDQLRQELATAKENAERANVANNLLDGEVAKMRLEARATHEMVQEVNKQHARATAKLDHLVSQDLEELTHKETKKYLMDVKAEHEGTSNRLDRMDDFSSKANHLRFGTISQAPNAIGKGSVSGGAVMATEAGGGRKSLHTD